MMGSWTFGRTLGAGLAAVVAVTIAMGIVAYYALGSVVDSKDRVIELGAQNRIDAERLRTLRQQAIANERAYLFTGERSYLQRVQEAESDIDEVMRSLRGRTQTAEARRLIDAVAEAERAQRTAGRAVLDLKRRGRPLDEVMAYFDNELMPASNALAEALGRLADHSRTAMDRNAAAATVDADQAKALVIGLGLGAALIAVLIAVFLTRTLGRQVGSSVQYVRSSSAELKAAASQQATGAKEQATAMSEITTTIGELLATSRQIAESAQRVSQMALDTAEAATRGDGTVREAQGAAARIEQQVESIVSHMLDLGKKSQQVGGILEIINELAEQTNILAINATIEAAGAGEAGRRFAVVGDEIRKLADRVSGSTKEIRALVEEMRSAVNATVMATETGAKTVAASTRTFEEVAEGFEHIGGLVTTTVQAAREIELSTKQQTSAVEQVNTAVSNVAQTTREMEASSGQTLTTASELSTLSDQLSRLIEPEKTT